MELAFSGVIWHWRGPAPHFFVSVPDADCGQLEAVSGMVSYGWGMIPATVRIGATEWTTSLWPKDGGYIVPVKAAVRSAEQLVEGDEATLHLRIAI